MAIMHLTQNNDGEVPEVLTWRPEFDRRCRCSAGGEGNVNFAIKLHAAPNHFYVNIRNTNLRGAETIEAVREFRQQHTMFLLVRHLKSSVSDLDTAGTIRAQQQHSTPQMHADA
jgi:hypothetical protein